MDRLTEGELYIIDRVVLSERPAGLTLAECGSLVGLGIERIRQIEIGALRKMRGRAWRAFDPIEAP